VICPTLRRISPGEAVNIDGLLFGGIAWIIEVRYGAEDEISTR